LEHLRPDGANRVHRAKREKSRIEVGTSGAPVFDSEGRVLGIVNKTIEIVNKINKTIESKHVAQMAVLAAALPRWVQLREAKAQRGPSRKSHRP
jgi:hypothetical protein